MICGVELILVFNLTQETATDSKLTMAVKGKHEHHQASESFDSLQPQNTTTRMEVTIPPEDIERINRFKENLNQQNRCLDMIDEAVQRASLSPDEDEDEMDLFSQPEPIIKKASFKLSGKTKLALWILIPGSSLLLAGTLLWTGGSEGKGAPWVAEPKYKSWMEKHNGFVANSIVFGDKVNVLFIGDSFTHGWMRNGVTVYKENYAPLGSANYGVEGDRIENILWRISNGEVEGLDPMICIVNLGHHNLDIDSDLDIAAGVVNVIDALVEKLPSTNFILVGLIPYQTSELLDRISKINALLAGHNGLNREGIAFLNLEISFQNLNHTLKPELYTDGMQRLSLRGYQIWQKQMDPVFQEMWNATSEI